MAALERGEDNGVGGGVKGAGHRRRKERLAEKESWWREARMLRAKPLTGISLHKAPVLC